MNVLTPNDIRFAGLPSTYSELCGLHLPRPIHDEMEYKTTLDLAGVFAGFEDHMTPDQSDYFDLLTSVLADWEAARSEWREASPLQILRGLLEEHSMSGADLSRLLGSSRQLGPMILRGDRSITADHARKLGKHFCLPAGTFVG